MTPEARTPEAVIGFWFDELTPDDWFTKSDATDAKIADRLGPAAEAAAAGALDHWAETPEGALALVLLLDQCPRNLYRDSGRAFAQDAKALAVAKAALAGGFDEALAGMSEFIVRTQGLDQEAARDMARFHMSRMPAWRDRS